jgi:hypothetical protein
VSEFFATITLSAGFDRPLRSEDTLKLVLSSALEAIAALEGRAAELENAPHGLYPTEKR